MREKVDADAERDQATEQYRQSRERMNAAVTRAAKALAALGKHLGYRVSAHETLGEEQGPAAVPKKSAKVKKKKVKERVPLGDFPSALTSRERLILCVGVKPARRSELEKVLRPLGCGLAATGLDHDPAFAKDVGVDTVWRLSSSGLKENQQLSATPDGKAFRDEVIKRLGLWQPATASKTADAPTPKFVKGSITGVEMLLVVLDMKPMTPVEIDTTMRRMVGYYGTSSNLYGPSKTCFRKRQDGTYQLTQEGLIRFKKLMEKPQGEAFQKLAYEHLTKKK